MTRKKDTALAPIKATPNIRTLEEKKVLTEDALKWSRNRLKKELQRRIKEAEKQCEAARILLFEPVDKLDEEALKLAKQHTDTIVDDSLWSFKHINHLDVGPGDKGNDAGLYGSLKTHKNGLVFGSERYKANAARYAKGNKLHNEACLRHVRDRIYEFDEVAKDANSSDAWRTPVRYMASLQLWDLDQNTYDEDEPCFIKDFKLEFEATATLAKRRKVLLPLFRQMDAADDALAVVEEDYANLDENMEELEMQAIEARLRENGGGDIIAAMTTGMKAFLRGGEFNSSPTLIGPASEDEDV